MDEPNTILPEDLRVAIKQFCADGDAVVGALVNKLNAEPVPQTIYHYTDSAGLRGILESGIVRFGDIFYLNDPSELRHGVGSALAILDEIGESSRARPELVEFASRFRDTLSSGIEVIAHYFVCCFSRNGDDLGQWRAYADDGRGYAVGFDAPVLEKAFVATLDSNASTFPITYSDVELHIMHRRIIENVVPLVSLPRKRTLDRTTLNQYMFELQTQLAIFVLQASIHFKHEAFAHEKEYRFLQMHRNGPVPDVKFRDKSNTLAGYREFSWSTAAPQALRRIMIGPAADIDAAERFVRGCLRAFQPASQGLDIAQSKIPYRAR